MLSICRLKLQAARQLPGVLRQTSNHTGIRNRAVISKLQSLSKRSMGTSAGTLSGIEGQSGIQVNKEVKVALKNYKPVVALETAIYTHGFPKPDNIALAREVEQAVRDNGAVPATIGFLNGVLKVGMTPEELEELASSAGEEGTVKCSVRDLSYILGLGSDLKMNGGTTIAATLFIASKFGLRVFATGGLGGVHREGETTMDISADLFEASKANVALVSSGMKGFLDYQRSLEYLETVGVNVATFGSRSGKTTLPGFWTTESSVASPFVVENVDEAAKMFCANKALGLRSTNIFFNPIPKENEIPREELEAIIDEAVENAKSQGISGKGNTPFILNAIKEKTGGTTLAANRALIINNAKIGAQLAVKISEISSSRKMQQRERYEESQKKKYEQNVSKSSPIGPRDIVVIGGIALDTACDISSRTSGTTDPASLLYTSNPCNIKETIGGVGHNITYALGCICESHSKDENSKTPTYGLVSAVGNDIHGIRIKKQLGNEYNKGIITKPNFGTARYIAINTPDSDLLVSAADMAVLEQLNAQDVREQIISSKAKVICVDGNLSENLYKELWPVAREIGARVFFEPTSVAKSSRVLADIGHDKCFPNDHAIDVATPNQYELTAMSEFVKDRLEEETLNLHSVLYSVITDDDFVTSIAKLQASLSTIPTLSGKEQPDLLALNLKSTYILPFIPTLFTKLGAAGVLLSRLTPHDTNLSDKLIYDANKYSITSSPFTIGNDDDSEQYVMHLQYFPPLEVDSKRIVTVNGAGDTFVGHLLFEFARGKGGDGKRRSIDIPDGTLEELVDGAQRAAVERLYMTIPPLLHD